MTVKILQGDCRDVLRSLDAESAQTVITSPPYWGLRDYGIPASVWGGDPDCNHEWGGVYVPPPGGKGTQSSGLNGAQTSAKYRERLQEQHQMKGVTTHFCGHCNAWRGAHGLEPTYQLYVENAVAIFREVWRVLRKDGTLWLNLGDCYATGAGKVGEHPGGGSQGAAWADAMGPMSQPNRMPQPGLKAKDMCGVPWRVAFALQADGWWLRQDIIWSKPNPMPESVRDRCTKAHEYIFLLSKSERYYFDQEAIAEPCSPATHARLSQDVQAQIGSERAHAGGKTNGNMKAVGRASWRGSTFDGPRDLAVRPNTGRKRVEAGSGIKNNDSMDAALAIVPDERNRRSVWTVNTEGYSEAHFATFPPALIEPCIKAGCPPGGTVLDPFFGAGTTGLVCDRLQRNCIGIELNASYVEMARRRITDDAPLLAYREAAE